MSKQPSNANDLSPLQVREMFDKFTKGEIDREMMKNYLEEHVHLFDTLVDGVKSFSNSHEKSSHDYIENIGKQIIELQKFLETNRPIDEVIKINREINDLLERLKEETNANRNHAVRFATLAAGVFCVIGGGAVFIANKNPELLKKGIETVAESTTKRLNSGN